MTLEALLAQYGLPALFLGAWVEGETVVVLGGVMVHRGLLGYIPAVIAAAMGSFVADQIFFALGRRFRNNRYVRKVMERPAFHKAIEAFEKRPTLFIFGFRFLYGLRTVSPIAIGTTNLPVTHFLAANAAAAAVWGTVFVTLGYLFGKSIETLFGHIREAGYIFLPVIGAMLVIAGIVYFVRNRRKVKAAD
jgi:membrane protein DedA with SNARE-associated domain